MSLCAGSIVLLALVVSITSLALAASTIFPDVPATHPYHAAITDLASRGVIGGYTDGDFGPGDPVTRQQFAKMIVLAGGYPVSESDACSFTDVDKGDASTLFPDNFIAVCAAEGITTGTSSTTFNPSGKITRYQAVSMVVRMADNLQPGLLAIPPDTFTSTGAWSADPTHGANAARAEQNGLLAGMDLSALSPTGNMSRGEVAQVLHNLLGKLTPASTTTTTKVASGWTLLHSGGNVPPARSNHTMVYDSATGKMILFGGEDVWRFFKDTWTFDPVARTWTDLPPSGSLPSGRVGHAMVYDSKNGKVIMFGGVAGDNYDKEFNDTWAYDPANNTWTELKPSGGLPSGRSGHSMVYDQTTGRVILFGGIDAGGNHCDTWAYDPGANTWTDLQPSGSVPTARNSHSMIYDSASGKVILFGGVGAWLSYDDRTWAYNPVSNTWAELRPSGGSPSGRMGHSMVYDQATGKVILFGGLSLAGYEITLLNDTWAYSPAANSWTEVKLSGGLPPARTGHSMVCDPASGEVLLFGGNALVSYLNDIWAYMD